MTEIFVDMDEVEKMIAHDKARFAIMNMREGYSMLCRLPPALGFVTAMKERHGRLVVETESGIEFIAPTFKSR